MLKILKNTVVYSAILILGIYLSIWAFSPFAANYFISQYLAEHQLQLTEDSTLRYNPFLSKLTIKNLAVNDNSTRVFTVSALTLEVSAYQLLSNKVNVSEFIIDGLYLRINRQDDSLTIAGINIPNSDSQINSEKKTDTREVEQTEAAELALQLIMPKMRLINSAIDIVDIDKTHSLQLKDIGIHVKKITPSLQNLSVTLLAQFNDAEVALSASTEMNNELGEIDFNVDIKEIDLHKFNHLFAPQVNVANGLVSYKGQHKIKLMKDGLRVKIADLGFRTQGLEVNKNAIHFALGEQDFNSDLLTIELLNENKLIVAGDADLQWQDVSIFNTSSNQVLLAMAQLGLNNMGVYVENGSNNDSEGNTTAYRLTINSTSLSDSFFSNNTEDDIPALTLFSALTINDIELTPNALQMDTIQLEGLKSNIQLDQNKQIKNLIMTLEELSQAIAGDSAGPVAGNEESQESQTAEEVSTNAADQQGQSDVKTEDSEFAIQLNHFNLVDSANIQFSDQSVSPNYARYIKINELNAGPFDNQKPNQTTIVTLKGISNQYTNFDLVMNIKPFLQQPEYALKGTLNQLDLESLTAYVKDALGYEIESGQLDLKLDTQLIGTKIKGNSHILLRGIELSSVENYESGESSGQGYIAFNTALGMLKDGDGNVELDLPISGDTSSPSFGLSGFISLVVKRATIAGAKEYLTMTFVPYASLVKVVLAADKHLLKVQISDLNYAPTVVDIADDQQEFLTTFSQLLKDKKDLQIKLCGVANAEDIGKEKGAALSRDDVESLIRIAQQRGNTFKHYMVEEKGIPSSRLLLCKPRIDNAINSVPHVRFET